MVHVHDVCLIPLIFHDNLVQHWPCHMWSKNININVSDERTTDSGTASVAVVSWVVIETDDDFSAVGETLCRRDCRTPASRNSRQRRFVRGRQNITTCSYFEVVELHSVPAIHPNLANYFVVEMFEHAMIFNILRVNNQRCLESRYDQI